MSKNHHYKLLAAGNFSATVAFAQSNKVNDSTVLANFTESKFFSWGLIIIILAVLLVLSFRLIWAIDKRRKNRS